MQTVRRIYLYLVAAVSLLVVTWSVIGLARLILDKGIGEPQLTTLASLLAAIIVGGPIFLFHWWMAQKLTQDNPEEREAIIRRIYFFGLLAAALTPILSNIYRLVDKAFIALLGGVPINEYPYDLTVPEHLAAIIIWSAVGIYLYRQLRADQNVASDPNQEYGLQRLFLLAFSLAGLVMVSWGSIGLLRNLIQFVTIEINWRTPIANYSSQLLVGSFIWLIPWLRVQDNFRNGDPAAERSLLRKIYLYMVIFAFALTAVVSTSGLLKQIIELLLGEPYPTFPLEQLSEPIPFMMVGILFWTYHAYILRQDIEQAPEIPRQASIRRVYTYLVAAIGLAVLWSGVFALLSLVVDLATDFDEMNLSYYRSQVALMTAMILAGLPVWFVSWRRSQHRATASQKDSLAERRSTMRKIYLYFYVFVAAMMIFGSIGWFIYHLLTALLGAELPLDFNTQVLEAFAISLLAGGVWWYHWQEIRKDSRLDQDAQAQQRSDITIAILDGDEGQLGQAILTHLRQKLPHIQVEPIGLTPAAVEAMSAPSFSEAGLKTLKKADYIVGSWQSLTSLEAAPTVTTNPALKIVVPTTPQNWIWAGLKSRSMEYYAKQVVRSVEQAIEGEDISPGYEFDLFNFLISAGAVVLFLILGLGSLFTILNAFT